MQTARAHLGKASSPGAPGGLQLGALPGVCLHFRRDVSQFSCLSALCRGTCNSVSAQWKYACLPYMLKGTILQVNETGCKKFFFFLLCTAVQSPRRDSVWTALCQTSEDHWSQIKYFLDRATRSPGLSFTTTPMKWNAWARPKPVTRPQPLAAVCSSRRSTGAVGGQRRSWTGPGTSTSPSLWTRTRAPPLGRMSFWFRNHLSF